MVARFVRSEGQLCDTRAGPLWLRNLVFPKQRTRRSPEGGRRAPRKWPPSPGRRDRAAASHGAESIIDEALSLNAGAGSRAVAGSSTEAATVEGAHIDRLEKTRNSGSAPEGLVEIVAVPLPARRLLVVQHGRTAMHCKATSGKKRRRRADSSQIRIHTSCALLNIRLCGAIPSSVHVRRRLSLKVQMVGPKLGTNSMPRTAVCILREPDLIRGEAGRAQRGRLAAGVVAPSRDWGC